MSTTGDPAPLRPFFLSGSAGDLFAVYVPPQTTHRARCGILFFPPFAEELNKSRRMAALQARHFAAAGYGVLLVDLFGTGDSAGDFGAACWDIWCDDMRCAAHWLVEQGFERLILWGLRCGALLAADVAAEIKPDIERMLFWQPVIRGEQMMTQFLRLRLAADLMTPGEKMTTQDLRAMLSKREPLEIAGYALAPELVKRIDSLDLKNMITAMNAPIDWLEVTLSADRPLAPVSRSVIEVWRERQINVRAATVAGEPFWNSIEIEVVPALLDRSTELIVETCA